MAPAVVNHLGVPPSPNTHTSDPIDTRGANLLVVGVGLFEAGAFSDSVGNVWTPLTPRTTSGCITEGYYCQNPTLNAAHTFTYTGTGKYAAMNVLALSGMALSGALDQQTGNAAATTVGGFQGGSLTPAAPNAVYVSITGFQSGGTQSVDAPFTISDQSPDSGNGLGCAFAYELQTAATARNPTWTYNNPLGAGVINAVFKAAVAAPASAAGDQVGAVFTLLLA